MCCSDIFISWLTSQKVNMLILPSQQLLGEWVRDSQAMREIRFLVTPREPVKTGVILSHLPAISLDCLIRQQYFWWQPRCVWSSSCKCMSVRRGKNKHAPKFLTRLQGKCPGYFFSLQRVSWWLEVHLLLMSNSQKILNISVLLCGWRNYIMDVV